MYKELLRQEKAPDTGGRFHSPPLVEAHQYLSNRKGK